MVHAMNTFGKQLSEARKAKGITQERLAEMLGITRQGISNWERGRSLPDLDAIKQLSHILEHEFTITDGILTDSPPVGPEPSPTPVSTAGKNRPRLFLPAFSFAAGALTMFLLMQFIFPLLAEPPRSGHVIETQSSGATGPETVSWFTKKEAPIPGKPYVVISFSENPAYAVKDPDYDNGYGWNFTVYLTEYNSCDFYPESYAMYYFRDEAHSVTSVYETDALIRWWGESKIPSRGQQCVTSGAPLQDIIGIGVKLSGRDAAGETMSFYGYMECLQEIK